MTPGLTRPLRAALSATALLAVLAPARIAAAEDRLVTPILRFGAGPAFHLDPGQRAVTQMAFDVTTGVGVGTNSLSQSSLQLMPELGYAYDHFGSHLFTASFGVGYGNFAWTAYYHPRFLVGAERGQTVVGMRNSLALHVFNDIYSLEVGHQLLAAGGAFQQDIHVLLGVNPLGALPFLPVFEALASFVNAL